jgi:hypothetical protein
MATYIIVNGTAAALTNVNAGGDDVPAYSVGKDGLGTGIVLTGPEAETLMAAQQNNAVLLMAGGADTAERLLAAKMLKLFKHPGKSVAQTP